jgi:hypothetical protein
MCIIATELGIKMAERGHEVHFITSNIPFRIRKPLPNITIHQVEVNQSAIFIPNSVAMIPEPPIDG